MQYNQVWYPLNFKKFINIPALNFIMRLINKKQ